jgi:thiosulfate dehydrogenase [quinone] large subunit
VGWVWLQAGWRHLQGPQGLAGVVGGWTVQAAAIGQTFVGIALILGGFVGVAAFAGIVIGSLVTGDTGLLAPLVYAASIWLVVAWKTAGWIGLDRWLLPLAGMPWQRSALLNVSTEWQRHEQ